MNKGFTTVTAASKTTYTAVPGDQIGVDTVSNIVTITLPAGAVGDEIVIMDVSASNGFATKQMCCSTKWIRKNSRNSCFNRFNY